MQRRPRQHGRFSLKKLPWQCKFKYQKLIYCLFFYNFYCQYRFIYKRNKKVQVTVSKKLCEWHVIFDAVMLISTPLEIDNFGNQLPYKQSSDFLIGEIHSSGTNEKSFPTVASPQEAQRSPRQANNVKGKLKKPLTHLKKQKNRFNSTLNLSL